jgi:drug/metabolite transporter (DMT)-like permease
MNHNQKAIFCVVLANICFGVNFSFVKTICVASDSHGVLLAPYGLNIIRVTVASLLFWLLYFIAPTKENIQTKHLGRFTLCAITGVIINQSLFIKGLALTSTIHASLLILVTPVFITLLAWVVLKENITKLKLAGLSVALIGAILLAFQKEKNTVGANILLGDVYIVINAISYAVYFMIVKPLIQVYKPLTVIRWVFTFSLPIMWVIGFNQLAVVQFSNWTVTHYGALAGVVLGATCIAYLCNAYALHHIGAARTGSFIYIQPFIATIIAIAFLQDSLQWQKCVAGILIMLGVLLINWVKAVPKANG